MKREWKNVLIKNAPVEIIDGDRGNNYPTKDEFSNEGYCLFLNANNVTVNGFSLVEKQFITKEKDGLLRKGKLQKNDIILTTRGTVGNVAFYNENILFGHIRINSGMVILRANTEYLLPNYLYLVMRSSIVQNQIKTLMSGSAQPQLPISIMSNIIFPLPPIQLQRAIAETLSCFDDKIQLNNRIIDELESMATTIYDYWFVQFDFPNAEGKSYRASGGEMVWNEQLKREIPKEWIVKPLPKQCSIIDCLHSAKPNMVYETENYYLLQLENLVEHGLISLENKYYVTKDMYKLWTSRIEVKEGDLVITNAGRVGSVARIPHNVKAGIGRNMTAIRPENIPPCFLYYFITGCDVAGQIKVNTDTGSFFGSLNVRGIKELLMTLPPKNTLNVLNDFDSLIYPLRRKIEVCAQENQELTKLRDWLLPMLLNRQVMVSEEKNKQGEFDQRNHKTYLVKKAARSFDNKEADDTKELLREYLEYKRNEKGTQD